MRQLIMSFLIFSSLGVFAQSLHQEKRIIKGLVWDNISNSTAVGAIVIQYKTTNGTNIQADGIFELEVPTGDTVLVHIPFCFESFYVLYLPTESYKKIVLNKRLKRQSQRTLEFWEKRKKA
jgi:hypothetical protein